MKTAIIGYSGAGKSTLAGRLAGYYGCPVLYLDRVQFEPGWKERDREEARGIVKEFMDREQAWVIDGTYSGFWQERRLAEADWILFFDFSRWRCLYQALKRYVGNRGIVRESAADGCAEKIDLEFILWILRDGRTRERRARFEKIRETYPEKTVVFRSHRDVNRWLRQIEGDVG